MIAVVVIQQQMILFKEHFNLCLVEDAMGNEIYIKGILEFFIE